MPVFTILLPHKLNPRNNEALVICMDCLVSNTVNDFALIMSAAQDQPLYETMNRLVVEASTDLCLFLHSDMFVSSGWDQAMLNLADRSTFVTGLLVEPGAMGVHHANVQKDFGRKPETFQRKAFEEWVKESDAPKAHGEGWVAPILFYRDVWLANGGHDLNGDLVWTDKDTQMLNKFKGSGGRIIQAQAPVYHLQRWSETEEQNHPKREEHA